MTDSVSFMPGFFELLVIGAIIVLPVLVLTVLPFWVIFEKAGFPGALSLLMMVPGINVIMLFVLAFARWPALERGEETKTAGRP